LGILSFFLGPEPQVLRRHPRRLNRGSRQAGVVDFLTGNFLAYEDACVEANPQSCRQRGRRQLN
jgi:hypothetical protein